MVHFGGHSVNQLTISVFLNEFHYIFAHPELVEG